MMTMENSRGRLAADREEGEQAGEGDPTVKVKTEANSGQKSPGEMVPSMSIRPKFCLQLKPVLVYVTSLISPAQ